MGFLKKLTSLKGVAALIAIGVFGAIGIVAAKFKFVKVGAWACVALVAVTAAWNDIKG